MSRRSSPRVSRAMSSELRCPPSRFRVSTKPSILPDNSEPFAAALGIFTTIPTSCRNLDFQTTAFHFRGERGRLPCREACLSLVSVSPPTLQLGPITNELQRSWASRREVTAGSGLLGVCAPIGAAVQTLAGPVAMGIASGDPALRPRGVAFLFPGLASGFPPVAWWTP